jgi:hypothetical protein
LSSVAAAIAGVETEPATGTTWSIAADVVAAVLTAADCDEVLSSADDTTTDVLIEAARLTIWTTPPTVDTAVDACPAMLSVLAIAADAVAAACAAAANLKPSDMKPEVAAVALTELNTAKPSFTCAVTPAIATPPTAMFFVREAAAVGLAALTITPAKFPVFLRDAAVLAAQFTDAASDCRIPPALPFKATALRAEPFSSIRYLTN